jgi:hypothetical protein
VAGADSGGFAVIDRIKIAEELPGGLNGERVCTPVEIVELCEKARLLLPETPANSTISTGGYNQRVVYPEDSIIADWVKLAQALEESADAFIIGAILPICGALLGRRVWFQWGERQKFANCFAMLAGKPGDRKSSIIALAEMLARRCLPESAFLPQSFSPETLFEEYSEGNGGQPDKLWIVDDANPTLTDWRKAVNGERVATRFLELYDCKSLSDHFRRNKDGTEGRRRGVPQTSTNVLFGATFNIACFQGQEVRAGMARRFLYYVAEKHGRLVVRPPRKNYLELDALAAGFRELEKISGEMDFSKRAALRWEQYQRANRDEIDQTDSLLSAKLSRLSSAPMQTLSLAMIFEAARFAKNAKSPLFGTDCQWRGIVEERTLNDAIEHVASCLEAADFLDSIANREHIAREAEIFLEHVRRDFRDYSYPESPGFIFVTRTDLTRRYCANSGRKGSWKPDDLYLRFIPHLSRRCEACLVGQKGKQEWFAFRAERKREHSDRRSSSD